MAPRPPRYPASPALERRRSISYSQAKVSYVYSYYFVQPIQHIQPTQPIQPIQPIQPKQRISPKSPSSIHLLSSSLLPPATLRALCGALDLTQRREWRMLYSSARDGHSWSSLAVRVLNRTPCLIAIRDTGGCTFGAFAPQPLSKGSRWGGSHHSFLWRTDASGKAEVFRASGENDHFVYCNSGMEEVKSHSPKSHSSSSLTLSSLTLLKSHSPKSHSLKSHSTQVSLCQVSLSQVSLYASLLPYATPYFSHMYHRHAHVLLSAAAQRPRIRWEDRRAILWALAPFRS